MRDPVFSLILISLCMVACRPTVLTGSSASSANRVGFSGDVINTSHDDSSKVIFEGYDNIVVFDHLNTMLNSKHRRDVIIVEGDGNMIRVTHRGTIDNSVSSSDNIVLKGDNRGIEILQEFLMDNSSGSRENVAVDLSVEDLSIDLSDHVRMDSIENLLTGEWMPLKEATSMYMMEAALGDPKAAFYLGEMFLLGVGMEMNASRAVDHYLMAARKGHIDSQFALGHIYETNYDGVGLDLKSAQYWYTEAANSGDPRAQQRLSAIKSTRP